MKIAPAFAVVTLGVGGWWVPVAAGATPETVERAKPRCHGLEATIVGSPTGDHLTGTRHRDVIVARGGNDTVDARGGNDVVCGGAGLDALDGGGGDDRLYGNADLLFLEEGDRVLVGDDLWGGPGDDWLDPGHDTRDADELQRDRVRFDRSSDGVVVDLARGTARGQGRDRFVPGHLRLVGSAGDDVVTGSDRFDWILTGFGADSVRAGAGDDVVWTDNAPGTAPEGGDTAYGGPGDDQVYGDGGTDLLDGGPGEDQVLDTGDSADTVRGGADDDLVGDQIVSGDDASVGGGTGKDTLDLFSRWVNPDGLGGPPSAGTFDMATGALHYEDPDDEVAMAVTGIEVVTLLTWGTAWDITGTPGDDLLCAGGSNGTTFHGLGGDDVFQGSPGDDLFDGGEGQDTRFEPSSGDDEYLSVEAVTDGLCGDFD